jgi:hypothetical protein
MGHNTTVVGMCVRDKARHIIVPVLALYSTFCNAQRWAQKQSVTGNAHPNSTHNPSAFPLSLV